MANSNTGHEFLNTAIDNCLDRMDSRIAELIVAMMGLTFPPPATIDKEPIQKKPFRKLSFLEYRPLKYNNHTEEMSSKPAYYR